jgi:ubiquinone/menaquinone biosynthesis C-methylase UbiE/uncharacterized protein YbaR (Trm112 family)
MISLLCPACARLLQNGDVELVCPGCGHRYQVVDGIPVLTTGRARYMGELEEARMEQLLREMAERGFIDAVHNVLKRESPFVYDYGCNPTRADFRFLMPFGENSTVLDLGSGLGVITREIAKQAGAVVSVDTVMARLRFSRFMCTEAGLDNITFICGGDGVRLPFENGTFDSIVMNGVLEWIPVTVKGDKPVETQSAVLADLYRCLKEKGALYIGNRFGVQYFLGARDHNNMRFTSLLPRRLADVVSRLAGKGPYLTITHSRRGYQKLLEGAGFENVRFFWTYPNYRNMQAVVPMEKHAVRYFLKTGLRATTVKKTLFGKAASLLLVLGLFESLAPFFGIMALKD